MMNKLITLDELHFETRIDKGTLLHHVQWYLMEGVAVTTQAHIDAWRIADEQIASDWLARKRSIAQEGQ